MPKTKIALILTLSITIILLIGDYYNWFNGHKFNVDFLSCVISNCVVIVLFIITYQLIDSKNLEKENNKREISNLLLNKTYTLIEQELKLYETGSHLNKCYINLFKDSIEKKDPSIVTSFIDEQKQYPFVYHQDIFSLAQDGSLSSSEYDNYLDIKRSYSQLIGIYFSKYHAGGEKELYRNERVFSTIKAGIDDLKKKVSLSKDELSKVHIEKTSKSMKETLIKQKNIKDKDDKQKKNDDNINT